MVDKRMAGDYEIIQSMMIGDKEIVLGENPKDTGTTGSSPAFMMPLAGMTSARSRRSTDSALQSRPRKQGRRF